MRARGDEAANELNSLPRTEDGRVLKCSTMPLRDADGALCINVDVTALRFAGDFDEIVDALIRQEETERAKPVAALSKAERLQLVRRLQEKGLFEVRGAAPRIAKRLGISRAALYNDLAGVRA